MEKYKDYIGLGIAGNFALHLAQAGELEEFKDIITAEEAAPKGMFPFYLPKPSSAKEMLHHFPLCSEYIQLPKENVNVQAEPEVALVCTLDYIDGTLSCITPKHFGAYNDCSIRVAGAEKISDKKNWGSHSKGLSQTLIEIDSFDSKGVMQEYAIASFLRRDNTLYRYGEDVALSGYSYLYQKLTHWMHTQLLTQEDFGPLEAIKTYLQECNNPKEAIISIGATRYTNFGEKTFLQLEDEVIVVLYNRKDISSKELFASVQSNTYTNSSMSVLCQKVR